MKRLIQRLMPVSFYRNRLTFAAAMLPIAFAMHFATSPVSAHDSIVPHLHPHAAEQTPESGMLIVSLAVPLFVLTWVLIRRFNRQPG